MDWVAQVAQTLANQDDNRIAWEWDIRMLIWVYIFWIYIYIWNIFEDILGISWGYLGDILHIGIYIGILNLYWDMTFINSYPTIQWSSIIVLIQITILGYLGRLLTKIWGDLDIQPWECKP